MHMFAITLRAVWLLTLGYLHAHITEDVGDIRTWWTTVIWSQEKTQIPPIRIHAGEEGHQCLESPGLYLWHQLSLIIHANWNEIELLSFHLIMISLGYTRNALLTKQMCWIPKSRWIFHQLILWPLIHDFKSGHKSLNKWQIPQSCFYIQSDHFHENALNKASSSHVVFFHWSRFDGTLYTRS